MKFTHHTAMAPLHWDDGQTTRPRICTTCRTESPWRRSPRGWATHPACEGSLYFDSASADVMSEALFNVHEILGVTGVSKGQYEPPPQPDRRTLGTPTAGCALPGCGRPFAALWIVAGLWACPAHSLIPISYRRNR